jgi:type II secretory pathway pseudopilin PulG
MTRLSKLFVALVLVIVLWLLAGCSVLDATYTNDTTRKAEYTWLAMHAIDTAQTVTIARSPTCLREADPLAVAIYGTDHPSPQRVLATNIALGFVHAKVGAWLDERTEAALIDPDSRSVGGWYVARGAFYVVSFLSTGIAIGGNESRGVKPFSHYTGCER